MTKKQIINTYFKARETSDLHTFFEIFDEDAEIYNVHFPAFKGREGIKAFCENFAGRISHCSFTILEILEQENIALVEWKAFLSYKAGAKVENIQVKQSFEIELRGVNRFDFTGDKIKCLRVYHETTSVVALAQKHSL